MGARTRHYYGDFVKTAYPALTKSIKARHVIIGGGITGLSAAYFLLEHGERDIVLIERHTIGSGATGHSAGMLVCEPDTASWSKITNRFGELHTKRFWDAQVAGLEIVAKVVKKTRADCDFMRQELLILAGTLWDEPLLIRDFISRRVLQSNVELLSERELKREFSMGKYFLAERVKNNISVNPLLFARAFAKYLHDRGVVIYEKTPMSGLRGQQVQTAGGNIQAHHIFRCLGKEERAAGIDRWLTTIAVTRPLTARELKRIGLFDHDMFFDDERRSLFYGKVMPDRRMLLGYGGIKNFGVHAPGYVHASHVDAIRGFLHRAFPDFRLRIQTAWSADYAISKTIAPLVKTRKGVTVINGAGTQLACIASSSYAVSSVLRKRHPLDGFFEKAENLR